MSHFFQPYQFFSTLENEAIFWGGLKGVSKIHSRLLPRILDVTEIENYLNGVEISSMKFNVANAPNYLRVAIATSMLESIALLYPHIVNKILYFVLQHLKQKENSQNFRQLCLFICIEVNQFLKTSCNSEILVIRIVEFMLQETLVSEDKVSLDLFSTVVSSLKDSLQQSLHIMLQSISTMKRFKVGKISKCAHISKG
jgi:hypothetical protein